MEMKKYIILILLVAQSVAVFSAKQRGGLTVYESRVEKEAENVVVTFRAKIDKKAVRRNHSLVFAPVLTDDNFTWSLPAIVVQGRGSRILEDRHIMASGRNVVFNEAVHARNGESVEYFAEVPYQLWMDGARLVMEAVDMGCCSSSELAQRTMAENMLLSPEVAKDPVAPAVVQPVREVVVAQLSTGEKLQQSYPFILPYSEFEELAPGQLFDDDRENAVTIYFSQGLKMIDPKVSGNSQAMSDLMSSIRIIQNSEDSGVKAVVVAGFASPEGPFERNDRLAWDRAVAVKKYIVDHSGLAADAIHVYNGSEDWRGLRMLVEQSDFWWKESVLNIIDTVPVWDPQRKTGREAELMRLHGGDPYKYMYRNWFPLLRNAAYIKVYFENK